MEIKWIKLTTDMFDNRKIKYLRKLPDGNSIVLIWVMLLTMAGRCNSGGMIFLAENIPYTAKMLADELDFEENTVALALKALENLGMISSDPLEITNWEEYQSIDRLNEIREYNRIAQQRHREKMKLLQGNKENVNDKSMTSQRCHETDIESDIESDKEIDKEFNLSISDDIDCRTDERQKVIDEWNDLGISPISRLSSGTKRYSMLNARLKEYGLETVLQAVNNVRVSSFLRGQNKDGWTITFDWFVKPNNFIKVLEGNYTDKEGQARQGEWRKSESTVDRLARLTKEGVFGE